jgi:alpha-ketoglutarate-dependent taurine dioxygenase
VPRGDTLFSNTTAAYEALPADTRKRLDGLQAVFSLTQSYEQRIKAAPTCCH